jgi:predicted RNA-binding protein with PIN domain
MSLHIVIDGYNLIRRSTTLSHFEMQDIQLGREMLLDRLVRYKKIKRHKITVVFDGINAPSFSPRRDRVKGIDILYSRNGETADTVIKKIVTKDREKAMVVSSDRDVVNFSEKQGAAAISSTDFEQKMGMAAHMDIEGIEPDNQDSPGWIPSTRKKGPRKRLSRKDRKIRTKIKKL